MRSNMEMQKPQSHPLSNLNSLRQTHRDCETLGKGELQKHDWSRRQSQNLTPWETACESTPSPRQGCAARSHGEVGAPTSRPGEEPARFGKSAPAPAPHRRGPALGLRLWLPRAPALLRRAKPSGGSILGAAPRLHPRGTEQGGAPTQALPPAAVPCSTSGSSQRPGQGSSLQSVPGQVTRGRAGAGMGASEQIKEESESGLLVTEEPCGHDPSVPSAQDTAQLSHGWAAPTLKPAGQCPGGRAGGTPWHESHLGRRPPAQHPNVAI